MRYQITVKEAAQRQDNEQLYLDDEYKQLYLDDKYKQLCLNNKYKGYISGLFFQIVISLSFIINLCYEFNL